MKHKIHALLMILIVLLITIIISGCSSTEENKVYKIGVANLAPPLEPILEGFKAGMEEAGYVEGDNIVYLYDGPAPSPEALDGVLENLKNEDVDLVLSFGTLATLKAKEILAGTDIPIVFGPVTDPVASGIVTSVLNPGGNITGIMTGNPAPKRLEWFLKIDPEIKRLYSFNQSDDNSAVQSLAAVKEIASKFGVEFVIRDANTSEELTTALDEMPEDIDAIFLPASAFFERNNGLFVSFANEHKLPLSAPATANVRDGALTSLGHDNIPLGRQAAGLAHQILGGIKPADLPVESAELFLSVNLNTANTIGILVPNQVLDAAHVIVR